MKVFYRKLDKYLLVLTFLCFLASCSSSKRIAYFQDLKPGESELFTSLSPHYIKVLPGDKITILINSREPQLAELFNLAITAKAIGTTSNNSGILSYTVDLEGYIEFPVLGAINVNGKTRKEIASLIKEELISRELLKDPVVTVEFANLCISVLGEVKTPGRYRIDRDKVTLLDAIGMAGDLTIYGKRDKVFVLRENGGTRYSYSVNLCSAEDKVEKYQIKGKETIAGNCKYYINDLGFNNYLYQGFGYGIGYKLENLIYLDLLRAGYQIYVGSIKNKEVDFVAIKGERVIYLQSTYLLIDKETIEREYASLEAIEDNYEKIVVSLDDLPLPSKEGIKHVQAWNLSHAIL